MTKLTYKQIEKNYTNAQIIEYLKKAGITGIDTLQRIPLLKIVRHLEYSFSQLVNIAKENNFIVPKHTKKIDLVKQFVKKFVDDQNAKIARFDDKIDYLVLDTFFKNKSVRFFQSYSDNLAGLNKSIFKVLIDEENVFKNWTPFLVNIFFKPKNGGRVLFRSIQADNINDETDFTTFAEWIDRMQNDPDQIKTGSGGAPEDLYTVDYERFEVIFNTALIAGAGSFKYEFFNVQPLNAEPGLCVFECLKKVCNITLDEFNDLKLCIIDNLVKYISDKEIDVAVIGNYIYTSKINPKDCFEGIKADKKLKTKFKHLTIEQVKVGFFTKKNYTGSNYIIYDIFKNHCEFTNNLQLVDNIYCDWLGNTFYKKKGDEFVEIVKAKVNIDNQMINKILKSEPFEEEYLFIDFETVTDWEHKNINVPYSLSVVRCEQAQLNLLDSLEKLYSKHYDDLDAHDMQHLLSLQKEFNFDAPNFNKLANNEFNNLIPEMRDELKKNYIVQIQTEFKKKYGTVYLGFDCAKQFLQYIIDNQERKVFIIMSFNGANFDNYLLYDEALKFHRDCFVGTPLITNGQLLDFKLSGRHRMFDLRKHLVGSLAANCASFGLSLNKKINGFNHHEMQLKYDNGTLIDFIKTDKNLYNYNIHDSLALAVLFHRYSNAINSIESFKDYNVNRFMTLGQLVMKKFTDECNLKGIELPKFSLSKKEYEIMYGEFNNDDFFNRNKRYLKYFNDLANSRVAGRVQLFNGKKKFKLNLCSPDVCSLYPYIMMIHPSYFPAGYIIESDTYEPEKNLLGFFYCDVDQSNLNAKICAKKTKDGNDWTANTLNNVFISSVMIDYLKEVGAQVVVKNGIYFSKRVRGCDLFNFLLHIMALKNDQDEYAKTKNIKYNPVLRDTYKLILNILSGKLNQKLNTDERLILNAYEFNQLINKKKKQINTVFFDGEKAHVLTKKTDEEAITSAKPICIGALIYDYAKIYMHRYVYSQIPYEKLIYTDTDSNKLLRPDFNNWVEKVQNIQVPHWSDVEVFDKRYEKATLYMHNQKVFGSFEDEYEGTNNNLSYFLAKKCYLVCNSDFNDIIKNKQFSSDEDKQKFIKKNLFFHFKGVSANDCIVNNVEEFKQMSDKDKAIYYNSKDVERIKTDFIHFFDQLYTNGKAAILTSSLKRVHNNQKKNVTPDDTEKLNKQCYKIVSSYNVKQLTV